jgi:8-oxo-dGTP pyrophosphatase MutT (NUDIX family)
LSQQIGPWTRKSRRCIYENPHLSLYEDDVVQPDGQDGAFAVVEVPAGVSVLPLDGNGNVILTRQFRYMYGQESVEAISGGVDEGETPLQAAQREAEEEAGVRAGTWQDLGELRYDTSKMAAPVQLFLAQGLTFQEPEREGTETITLVTIPLEEAYRMVMDSRIVHGPSAALILKAYCLLHAA